MERAARKTLETVLQRLQDPVDPVSAQLGRVLRVGIRKGFVEDMVARQLPALARTALAQGLKSRSIHALHATLHPDRPALVDDQVTVTYAEANDEMNRAAHALRGLGVRAGAPVVLMMENCVRYVLGWFALARLGARAVHASYRLTPAELEYLLDHSSARLVMVSGTTVGIARELLARRKDLKVQLLHAEEGVEMAPGELSWRALVAGQPATFPARESDVQSENIVYTSGTTGRPKGAVRDFAAFGLIELSRVLERLPFRAGDRHLVVSPLYHSAGQIFTLLNAAMGSTVYLRPHFEPEDTLAALSRHSIHSIFLVPTMINRLLGLPEETFRAHPTPHLRGIVSGAAEFPQALREAAIRRFGAHAIHDFYGATELGWVTIINGQEMLTHPGSVGKPLAGQEVQVMSPDGRVLPRGEIGLVYVRNAQTMQGYLNDAEATRESMHGDWMTTEDLGYLDRDGYLFLAGRERDMVKSGGVNVYPVEIEEVLLRHPNIKDVAVIGVKDLDLGEKLVAVVVPRGDPGSFHGSEVESWARGQLAGLKIPRRWELMGELPRNNTGKVMKKELRARFDTPGPA